MTITLVYDVTILPVHAVIIMLEHCIVCNICIFFILLAKIISGCFPYMYDEPDQSLLGILYTPALLLIGVLFLTKSDLLVEVCIESQYWCQVSYRKVIVNHHHHSSYYY